MGHGNVKKPSVQKATPTAGNKQKVNAHAHVKQGAANPAGGKQHVHRQHPVTPPPTTMKGAAAGRAKHVIWADDNDVDIEDLTFAVPIIISVILLAVFLLRKYLRWSVDCPSENKMYGKTVVITGGNTGIGRATATELSKRGARVIIGCREKLKGDAVVLQIRTKTKNDDVYCYRLDLASLSSIKEFVEEINNREPSLHVLINNAAYMGPKSTTVDGYERAFGVNYLGHFYLTYLLKDKLKRGAPSRVINLISDSYSKAKLDFEDLPLAKYDIYGAYARSKLAMVSFTSELHKRLIGDIVHVYGVHPGCVSSDLLRNWPGVTGNLLRTAARILFKSPEAGCQTVVFCAVADKMRELSGKTLENCKVYKIKSSARDRELGEKLWNVSLHLCALDSEIPEMDAEQESRKEASSAANGEKAKPTVEEIGASEPPAEMKLETKKDQ